jgi:hypothetical protein
MAVVTFTNRPWIRHHDPQSIPIRPNVAKITCFDTLEDLIQICALRPSSAKLKASGSHWGLSEAALSDDEAIETNWPGSEVAPRHAGLDVDLNKLFSRSLLQFLVANPPGKAETLTSDPCLNQGEFGLFYVHVKSGTRIYQVYSLLDQLKATPGTFAHRLNRELDGTSNANAYDGPWAFNTLGGAGGQTINSGQFLTA